MSIENKIISFFIRHPEYFLKLISYYFPLNRNQLSKYSNILKWNLISRNQKINWDEDIIERVSAYLDWSSFSANPGAFKDISLIQKFKDRINWKGRGIASNKGISWSPDLIAKYETDLSFYDLSHNPNAVWTEDLIDKYIDQWDYSALSNNSGLPWSLTFLEKYLPCFDQDRFYTALNKKIYNDFEIVDKYHHLLDWYHIWENSNLPWIEKDLLNRWKDYIVWRFVASNEFLLGTKGFFEKHLHFFKNFYNCFYCLSHNEGLKWSSELIDRYMDLWSWENLSINKALPWSKEFIAKYDGKLQWGGLEFSSYDEEIKEPVYFVKFGMIHNANLPWTIDFLTYYENEINFDQLFYNPGVWEKAFMPYVDDRVINTVLRIL